jgi:hypothetical protein
MSVGVTQPDDTGAFNKRLEKSNDPLSWSLASATTALAKENVETCRKFPYRHSVLCFVFHFGFLIIYLLMKNSVIWRVIRCSPVKVNLRFGGIYSLNLQGQRVRTRSRRFCLLPACTHRMVSCLIYYSTVKTEAIFYSGTLLLFYKTARRHTPEDIITLNSHPLENGKSNISFLVFVFISYFFSHAFLCLSQISFEGRNKIFQDSQLQLTDVPRQVSNSVPSTRTLHFNP